MRHLAMPSKHSTRSAPENMNRRSFLRTLSRAGMAAAALTVGAHLPRIAWGEPSPDAPLWVHIQADGGWDQCLTFDPKPSLRSESLIDREVYLYSVPTWENGQAGRGTAIIGGPSTVEVRTAGGISYLAFADFHADLQNPDHPYKPFLPTYHDRITIFNGVDTATNNHSVGARYSASGTNNEGSPCFATQLAAARGVDKPLAFLNLGGYDETANLVQATPLDARSLPYLLRAVNPNDLSGNNRDGDALFDPPALARVRQAHEARTLRLMGSHALPSHKRALESYAAAAAGVAPLEALKFSGSDQTRDNMILVGLEAFRQGLAVSMNMSVGGFDTHMDNSQYQAEAYFNLFEALRFILEQSENPADGKSPLPVVIVVTSDFGRSPYFTGGGTDHWPTSSTMVIQNRAVTPLPIPTSTVIGSTTLDLDPTASLAPIPVNPQTLQPDPSGVLLTPGHIMRVLRRAAKIDAHPALAAYPIQVEGDLDLG
jgi:hypothetical protein